MQQKENHTGSFNYFNFTEGERDYAQEADLLREEYLTKGHVTARVEIMHRLALIERMGFDPLPGNDDEREGEGENIIRELPSTGLDIPPADEAIYRPIVILVVVLATMGIWHMVLWFLKFITTG